MKRQLMVSLTILMLAACTENTRPARQARTEADLNQIEERYNAKVEDPNQEVVCRREAVTGSWIKETRCRTRALMQQQSDDGRRYLDKPRPFPTDEL